MSARPSYYPPQTSKQAKAAYKRHGPRISERELRQIDRGVELQERADRIKEKERRRKVALQKKAEKEQKDRAARASLGVGLATQMVGYSHSQRAMKNGMEAFLGMRKGSAMKRNDSMTALSATEEQLEKIIEEDVEPWDLDDHTMGFEDAQKDVSSHISSEDAWSQDGLDDEALLLAHEQAMPSEPWDEKDLDDAMLLGAIDENTAKAASSQTPLQIASQIDAVQEKHVLTTPGQEPGHLRLHGPVDKAIEKILESLPEPLIELLSQDMSSKPNTWDPAPSLLHRLNPLGLPPHRLRIKVGCTVVLLRDLNTSSQLSRSGHLRILKVAKERLECIILDGQLEGTKTFITRVSFTGRYRNDDQYTFTRTQFPIRVSPKFAPPNSHEVKSAGTNPPVVKVSQKSMVPKRNHRPNPGFKLPTLPASRTRKPPSPNQIVPIPDDCWDDFLDSSTQIARDLALEECAEARSIPASAAMALSTQDFDISFEDLKAFDQSTPEVPPTSISTRRPSAGTVKPSATKETKMAPPPRPSILGRSAVSKAPPPKRINPSQHAKQPAFAPKMRPIPAPSFSDFGFSTQEVVSILEDDDAIFSSPPIAAQ